MPITNGHEVNVGLCLDGHWGWHNHVRMLGIAEDLGWEIDDELRAIMTRYDAGESDPDGNDHEIVIDAMDEAERWLNDHTHAECMECGEDLTWSEVEGSWVHGDGEHQADDRVRRYVWYWHDGEFFLSPICENGDCDDDTCAHWD
jgi:hypothetical protein